MKYIKKYELTEYEETHVIYSLGRSIKDFMDLYLGLVGTTNGANSTSFWQGNIKFGKKHIFTIQGIDHYHGDVDKYFEFELDKTIDVDHIGQKTYNMVMFINSIMDKYKDFQNLIAYSKIDNIIKDLSNEEYEIFIQRIKYNL